MAEKSSYLKETDLCAAFIAALPDTWQAYPETCGFDILLVRKEDGFQIGVEAKLKLNAKVISQAAENLGHWYSERPGPDCRAVLIPEGVGSDLVNICNLLGVVIIRMKDQAGKWGRYADKFRPCLPDNNGWKGDHWYEFAPHKRLEIPDYIPDSCAGSSSPISLTPWKVKAIKIAVTLEQIGYVTRADFKYFQINMSRWTIPGVSWLIKDGKGGWIKGPNYPDFKAQHPKNYDQIAADFEVWKNPEPKLAQTSMALT